MTRAVYLVGGPGTGKTTAVTLTLAGWRVMPDPIRLGGAMRGHSFGAGRGLLLGVRRDTFGGTDALSMAAHPDAVAWANTAPLPQLVLGEGARLGTVGFLTALAARTELTVFHLVADPDALAARFTARGSAQNPTWVRGAVTRAANAAAGVAAAGVAVVTRLDTSTMEPAEVAERVRAELRRAP